MKTVLLDLDGVLIDFQKRCLEMHNATIDWKNPDNFGQFDMAKILGISQNEFWKPINTVEFWESLEWMEDGKEILEMCESYTSDICLLTSPSAKTSACYGKANWIHKHMPKYKRKFLIGAPKEFCAHRDAILIDDKNTNVDNFKHHGGWGLLLPRPWNRHHWMNTMEELENTLDKFFGGKQTHD